jgi:non-ribosomal peptide synthetase component F
MGARDFTLTDTIERNAQLYGERLALVFGEEQVTHAEHRAGVARLAAGLHAAGVQPGDRIAIIRTMADARGGRRDPFLSGQHGLLHGAALCGVRRAVGENDDGEGGEIQAARGSREPAV